MYYAIVFLPLIGFLIAGLFGRQIGDKASQVVTASLVSISALLSWVAFMDIVQGYKAVHPILTWMALDDLTFKWALKIDMLTGVMLVVVNSVSALVHWYSMSYMEEDPHKPRFFAYLSLFTFAMLMLVTANNLVQMFFGWEGVGLASYLLIGFWFKKESANAAAMKAFVVNRVGDFGFSLGIFAVFMLTGSVVFDDIFASIGQHQETVISFLGADFNAITIICVLLFIGAMGKSAQLGLHTWLPDAMEGPTPVSALIHAATMVTAGVFLVARFSPVFSLSEIGMMLVTIIGAMTALFAASVGLVQNDIKRVIAYSTCSQLGYMFVALGLGAFGAGIFHLFTHAFFKALLFLGAGSVIHAMHHEQDMRNMGGLAKKIPLTAAVMLIGTLAITGFPLLSGYFSKDTIIFAAYASEGGAASFAYVLIVLAAFMTSFYSWRLAFLTFFGDTRADDHTYDHAHEGPFVMKFPLITLAIGALFAGWFFAPYFIGADKVTFWDQSLVVASGDILDQAAAVGKTSVSKVPFFAMILGFFLAMLYYAPKLDLGKGIALGSTVVLAALVYVGFAFHLTYVIYFSVFLLATALYATLRAYGKTVTDLPQRTAEMWDGLYAFLLKKWYFDELYHFIFIRPSLWLGRLFWKRGDEQTIDGFGPDGVSSLIAAMAARLRKIQTGYLYHYAFVMLIGVALIVTYFISTSAGH